MTDPQIGISMLVAFIGLIMLGFPIAFTLMAMGVSFGFYAYFVPGTGHVVTIASSRCWSRRPSRSPRTTC